MFIINYKINHRFQSKNMKNILLISALLILSISLNAQRYTTKNGFVGFYSHTPMEDIKADNNQVASIIDITTGDVVFLINNKSFIFERALMQEHFNENYMETEKYGKTTFKGKIADFSFVTLSKPGIYNVKAEGKMDMHGVVKTIAVSGTIEVTSDGLIAKSTFQVKPEDYGIIIPNLVREKIANEMQVTVNIKYPNPVK